MKAAICSSHSMYSLSVQCAALHAALDPGRAAGSRPGRTPPSLSSAGSRQTGRSPTGTRLHKEHKELRATAAGRCGSPSPGGGEAAAGGPRRACGRKGNAPFLGGRGVGGRAGVRSARTQPGGKAGRSEGAVWPEGGLCGNWGKKPLGAMTVGRSQNPMYTVGASVGLPEEEEEEDLWARGAASRAAQHSCLRPPSDNGERWTPVDSSASGAAELASSWSWRLREERPCGEPGQAPGPGLWRGPQDQEYPSVSARSICSHMPAMPTARKQAFRAGKGQGCGVCAPAPVKPEARQSLGFASPTGTGVGGGPRLCQSQPKP